MDKENVIYIYTRTERETETETDRHSLTHDDSTHNFLTLLLRESNMHSVEAILQIWDLIFFQASDVQYNAPS